MNHTVPPVISLHLRTNKDVHRYNTRNKHDFNFTCDVKIFNKDSLSLAAYLWNKLPQNLKSCPSLSIFQNTFKKLFII